MKPWMTTTTLLTFLLVSTSCGADDNRRPGAIVIKKNEFAPEVFTQSGASVRLNLQELNGEKVAIHIYADTGAHTEISLDDGTSSTTITYEGNPKNSTAQNFTVFREDIRIDPYVPNIKKIQLGCEYPGYMLYVSLDEPPKYRFEFDDQWKHLPPTGFVTVRSWNGDSVIQLGPDNSYHRYVQDLPPSE